MNVETKNIFRLETPIKADPKTTTFEEIKTIANMRLHLKNSTIEHNLRYLKHAELHPYLPLKLTKPDYINFIRHLDYRIQLENFSINAEHHLWKAMKMYLRCIGQKPWDYKPRPKPKSSKRILPFPEIVREFWHYRYSTNRITRKLYQYMFFHGYMIGLRTPSELASLQTNDIIFNRNGTAILTITEHKKNQSQRTIILPYELATDPRHKSLKVWLNSWRPKIANSLSGDYLFLQRDGKPWTVRHLGHKLSILGKQVWKHYHPYDMRHWNAIAQLIEQKETTGTYDIYPVMNWLGHEKPGTTMSYVKHAEQYYNQASYSWLRRVLKHPKKMEDSTLKPRTPTKRAVSVFPTGETENGLGEIYFNQQKDKQRTNTLKTLLSVFPSTIFSFFNDSFFSFYKKIHHEGSQLKKVVKPVLHTAFSSSPKHHQNSEIPLPLTKKQLLLRARNKFFILYPPQDSFKKSYPSPASPKKNYNEKITEENGCFESSLYQAPFSPFLQDNKRWCDT